MCDSIDEPAESRTLLEVEPLDSPEQNLGAGFKGLRLSHKRRRTFSHTAAPLTLHLLLVTFYTVVFFIFWDSKLEQGIAQACGYESKSHAYSPALEALRWEPRVFEGELNASNPFKGPPRPELDDAWNDLLGPTAIRVDKKALDKINRTSVPLRDGSGYMATLDVYHQLHCLKYIRRYLNPDYYNLSEPNLPQHIDHCLDGLRQYVMCNADVVLLTYDWIPNYRRPWPNFRIGHECASWDAIDEWARKHSFDGFDNDLIKHPDFHPELPSPFDSS